MIKYYSVSNSTDEKIIGKKYPQCKGLPSGMGLTFDWFDQPNSMTNLNNDEFPNFEPELFFELEEKAILTDIVSPSNISAKGFLVNQKVKDILNDFNIMEHKFYPATLIVKDEKLQYYWLHFKENRDSYLNYVDFKNSSLYVGNLARWKETDLIINNIEDYIKIKKNIGFKTINFEKLCFTESFYKTPKELFYIDNLHNDFLISNKLAHTLQSFKIKGIEVYESKFYII